jgi:hypothetical protein
MGTTAYKSGTLKKLLPALAFLPIGVMLFIQSMGWPNNFDDFYRGFNGINTDHDVLQYGWLKSQVMLKHLVHDPLLTWSNQLDYRWPFISGIVETILLVGFMSMVTRNALANGNRHIAFAIILLFNLFVGVQSYTFLPPAAFPLAFSASFIITVICNTRFDALSNDELFPKRKRTASWLGHLSAVLLIALEQLAFLFYASNFVQSIVFWTGSNIQRALSMRSYEKNERLLRSQNLWAGLRFIPFIVINTVWRSQHGANGAETFSKSLNIIDAIVSGLRWNLGGTNIGGYVGMMHKHSATIWAQPLWIILISILIGIISFFLACWTTNKKITPNISHNHSKKLIGNLLILGISIVAGWTIPALSERYYQELVDFRTQTYVASRFAAFGLLLTISIVIGFLLSQFKTKRWHALAVVMLISSISVTENISSLTEQMTKTSLKLSDVCSGNGAWNQKLLLPKGVFKPEVDTSIWLTNFEGPKSNITVKSKREAAIKQFENNSLRFCD